MTPKGLFVKEKIINCIPSENQKYMLCGKIKLHIQQRPCVFYKLGEIKC